MKKLTIISSIITTIMIAGAGCSASPTSLTYSPSAPTTVQGTALTFNTSTVKTEAIKEFLMGYTKDRSVLPNPEKYTDIMDIFKINHLTGETQEPIYFDVVPGNNGQVRRPCAATTTPDEWEQFYCLNNDTYRFEVQNPDKIGTTAQIKSLFHNEKLVVTGLCMDGASDMLEDIKVINNQLTFTFVQNCDFEHPEKARRNIYYNGETYNEKYQVQGTHYLFAYQGKLGFVMKKDNKEYIIFNNKIISPAYSAILTHGCCMNPHYLQVFKNGKLDFMAVKDEKDYLVEIDLNSYLE